MAVAAHTYFTAQIPGYKSAPYILLDILSRERSTCNRENKVI